MGDMSRCKHNQAQGYCDDCNPGWELQLITADAQDKIFARGVKVGIKSCMQIPLEDEDPQTRASFETLYTSTFNNDPLVRDGGIYTSVVANLIYTGWIVKFTAHEAKIKELQKQLDLMTEAIHFNTSRLAFKEDGVWFKALREDGKELRMPLKNNTAEQISAPLYLLYEALDQVEKSANCE